MKKYVTPSLYTSDKLEVNNSSFKQVANSFSSGFAKGVASGMRGNTERPVALQPVEYFVKI